MSEFERNNAIITSVRLGYDRGTIPTAWIYLDYGGAGQGFGGFNLGPKYTDAFVFGVLDAIECESWEELPGKPCRVTCSHTEVRSVGHFLKDKWFEPRSAFESIKTKEESNVEL